MRNQYGNFVDEFGNVADQIYSRYSGLFEMTGPSVLQLDEALGDWRHFRECLFVDVRPVEFDYGVELTFNYTRDNAGAVRPDILENPVLITVRLLGWNLSFLLAA
jgi:hypothetical protein